MEIRKERKKVKKKKITGVSSLQHVTTNPPSLDIIQRRYEPYAQHFNYIQRDQQACQTQNSLPYEMLKDQSF